MSIVILNFGFSDPVGEFCEFKTNIGSYEIYSFDISARILISHKIQDLYPYDLDYVKKFVFNADKIYINAHGASFSSTSFFYDGSEAEIKLLILHDSVFLFSYLERYFKYFKGSIELHKNFFTENEVKIYGHSNEDSYLKKLTILKEGIRASYLNASVDIREDPVFKKWFESVLDSDHANFPKQGYGIDFFDEDFLENFYIGKADIFLDELKFKDAFEMLCDIRLLAEYKKATDKKCTLFLSNPCLFNMEKIAEYIKTIKAKSFIVLRQMNSKGLLRSRFIKGIPYFPSDILYFSEHDMRDVEPFIFGDQITSFELARRIEEEKYGVNQIEEYLANYRSFLYTDFQEKNIEEKIEDIKNESFSSIDFRVKKELSKEVLSFFMNKKIKNIDHKAELTPEQRLAQLKQTLGLLKSKFKKHPKDKLTKSKINKVNEEIKQIEEKLGFKNKECNVVSQQCFYQEPTQFEEQKIDTAYQPITTPANMFPTFTYQPTTTPANISPKYKPNEFSQQTFEEQKSSTDYQPTTTPPNMFPELAYQPYRKSRNRKKIIVDDFNLFNKIEILDRKENIQANDVKKMLAEELVDYLESMKDKSSGKRNSSYFLRQIISKIGKNKESLGIILSRNNATTKIMIGNYVCTVHDQHHNTAGIPAFLKELINNIKCHFGLS